MQLRMSSLIISQDMLGLGLALTVVGGILSGLFTGWHVFRFQKSSSCSADGPCAWMAMGSNLVDVLHFWLRLSVYVVFSM
jgi:hypothetical protein